MSALDLRLLGRLGGAGLVAGAVALFALMGAPQWDTAAGAVATAVSIAAAIGGIAALRVRWTAAATRAGMVLTAGAYLALGVAGVVGGGQAVSGPLFVVVAAWCGLALGPGYVLRLSPLALLCDTLPAWVGRPGTALTGLGAIAVATVTGEIFGRLADRVRRDARRDAHDTQALERLTAGQVELARAADATQAATIAAAVARDLLDAAQTAVLVERDGELVVLAAYPPAAPGTEAQEAQALGAQAQGQALPSMQFEVPLTGRDGTGVRGSLAARPRLGQRLDPFGQTLAASLAAATCAALESIALNSRLRLRAEIDPLTGLGNRRRLAAALSRLKSGDVVIVLDLDHFKAVNDALGHDTGDQVLRAFGAHLSTRTRAGELAVRTGGEEFVVIADGGEGGRAVSVLLRRLATEWWDQSPLTTFSAGAAVHRGGDAAITLKRADQALYEAKRRGRTAGWITTGGAAAEVTAGVAPPGRLISFPGQPFRPRRKAAGIFLPVVSGADVDDFVSDPEPAPRERTLRSAGASRPA